MSKDDWSILHRENPERAIFVDSEIDAALVRRLTPQIIRLKHRSREPICMYIDSVGGSTFYTERLIDLIKSPTQDGESPNLITVVTGFAASAAADLLAFGDYAIAYPEAHIHYHGSRQGPREITVDAVQNIVDQLKALNERFALRLASRMFRRLVFLMLYASETRFPINADTTKVFFGSLSQRVSDSQKALISTAIDRQTKIQKIVAFLESKGHSAQIRTPEVRREAELLKHLIDFEVGAITGDHLSASHLMAIQEDFVQLNDFYFGQYLDNIKVLAAELGTTFLDTQDAAHYANLEDSDEKREFLLQKVSPSLNPLWYLVVSICRLLQEGEHPLSPVDAYWLGIVDEVVGSELPNLRELVEHALRQMHKDDKKGE